MRQIPSPGSDQIPVDLWWANLVVSQPWRDELVNTLNEEELIRAENFYFEKDQTSFIARRGLLRVLLGARLSRLPQAIDLTATLSGKPILAGRTGLQFNLSSSADRVLIATTPSIPLGVDLQKICPIENMDELAPQVVPDIPAYSRSSSEEKGSIFHRSWVRMEAYLKASGVGLDGLGNVSPVLLDRDSVPAPDCAETWTLINLDAGEGFAAALCAGCASCRISVREHSWNWPKKADLEAALREASRGFGY